jgi:K+-sensing histidine kinase KdpD
MSSSQERERRSLTTPDLRVARYGIAITTVAFAAAINWIVWPAWGVRYPLIVFYPAITVSAWFGGLWPGLASTVLSGAVAASVWFGPGFSWRLGS